MTTTADVQPTPAGQRTELILRHIRRSAAFRELVPADAAIGWPGVTRIRGDVFLRTLLFRQRPRPEGSIDLYRPFARLTISWDEARIAAYVDLRADETWVPDQANPVGVFPHEGLGDSESAYLTMRGDLLSCYDQLCIALASGNEPALDIATKVAQLLRVLLEPSLEPYYRRLDPDFFERYLPPMHASDVQPAGRASGASAAASAAGARTRSRQSSSAEPPMPASSHTFEELGALIREADQLVAMAGTDSAAADLAAIKQRFERSRGVLAVVGSMKSGRSTLANILLGASVLPSQADASTASLIRVVSDVQTQLRVGDQVFDEHALDSGWTTVQSADGGPTTTDVATVGVDNEWLREAELEVVDTPGLDTPGGALATGHALQADLAVMSVAALNPLDMGERAFLEHAGGHGLPVLVVITQLDRVDEAERASVVSVITDRVAALRAVVGVLSPAGYAGHPTTDELRRALEPPLAHNRRRTQRLRQIVMSLQLLSEDLIRAANEGIETRRLDTIERARLARVARARLETVAMGWDRLEVELEQKRVTFDHNAEEWLDAQRATVEERLAYELAHSPNPKMWWEQDLPFRLRQELTTTADKAEQSLTAAIRGVHEWLGAEVKERFGTESGYTAAAVDGDEFGAITLRDLDMRDADRIRERALASAAVAYLLTGLNPLPMVLAGVGGELFRKRAVDRQRDVIVAELGQVLNETYGRLRKAFLQEVRTAYDAVIGQLRQQHERWQQERLRALEQTDRDQVGDEGERLSRAARSLQDKLRPTIREEETAR